MSNLPATKVTAEVVEKVLVRGDLSALTPQERVSYYNNVCVSLGLNPLTKPFEYIELNKKLVLYARRDCTDQLRNLHKVSIAISDRQKIDDVYVVTAKAKNADGREDESTGAVNVTGLKGESLANALMKAETKAKRRVTLSICGLGMLDETEVETIAPEKPASPFQEIKKEKEAAKVDLGEYIIKFGKRFAGKKLKDVDMFDLNDFVEWTKKNAGDKPSAQEFIQNAEAYLSSIESKEDSIVDAAKESMNEEVMPF